MAGVGVSGRIVVVIVEIVVVVVVVGGFGLVIGFVRGVIETGVRVGVESSEVVVGSKPGFAVISSIEVSSITSSSNPEPSSLKSTSSVFASRKQLTSTN